MNVEDYHFYKMYRVSKAELESMRDYGVRQMQRRMREELCEFALKHIRERKDITGKGEENFHVDYAADVYVIPPDVLYGLIHAEAERLVSFMRRREMP